MPSLNKCVWDTGDLLKIQMVKRNLHDVLSVVPVLQGVMVDTRHGEP